MQWRFWRRGGKKKDVDQCDPLRAETNALAWPASAGAKEILGLQKLVGNQAVLRMLARNSNGAQAKSQ